MPNKLSEELKQNGFNDEPDVFRDILVDHMFNGFGSWTIDDLLCHPAEALEYCEGVRKRTGGNIPDYVILKTLLNIRKCGH